MPGCAKTLPFTHRLPATSCDESGRAPPCPTLPAMPATCRSCLKPHPAPPTGRIACRLLWSRDFGREPQLCCAALAGTQLWLGGTDGCIRAVTAAAGELSRAWKAFDFPVVALAHDANPFRGLGLVYGLSEHGSVRAWPAALPDEATLVQWRVRWRWGCGVKGCVRTGGLCGVAGLLGVWGEVGTCLAGPHPACASACRYLPVPAARRTDWSLASRGTSCACWRAPGTSTRRGRRRRR